MQHKAFVSYLSARACVSLTSNMMSVAIGWHLYQLTGNPFDLAMIGLMQIIPILALFILTGWVVDHLPRKQVLIACVAVETLLMSLVALVMAGDEVDKHLVFALLFLLGCSRAFYRPAQEAILPNIVVKAFFPRAVAITAVIYNTASTAGPFVAGIFLAWIDLKIYWFLALLNFASTIFYTFLPRLKHIKPTGRGIEQVLGGIRFIKHNPIVLGCISLDLFAVLFGSVMALLPVYVSDILHVGPTELGLMRGMPALGAVMVGLVMARIGEMRQSGRLLFVSLVIFACSILVFAFSQTLWISLLALWVYGGVDTISVNVRSTLIQIATPNDLRGRVSAVNTIFIASSNQLGDFRAGSIAAILTPVATVAIGGLMALGIAIGGYYLFPNIRKLDKLADASVERKVSPKL